MLSRLEQDRPALQDFLRVPRLGHAGQKAKNYLRFTNPDMIEAGLKPTSREGVWLMIAEESLSFKREKVTEIQKIILLDLFSVLRRMYKSADEVWDQNQDKREYIMANSATRVMETLTWENQGVANITDMPLALKYLNIRLLSYFPDDTQKRSNISASFGSFIQDATAALVDFEFIKRKRQPEPKDCLVFYKRTAGRIGRTVGQVIGEVTNSSEETKLYLQDVFEKASVVSQLVDDIIDSPLDVGDTQSPSVVKAILSQNQGEYDVMGKYAVMNLSQISHRKFKQLAPITDRQLKVIFDESVFSLPPKLQQFLTDFYYALPPSKVSHADPLNKGWHTSLQAHRLMADYVAVREVK